MTPLSEIDEPFDGLVINGYGIYSKQDQKAISQLFLKEYERIEAEVIGEDENPMNHPVAMEIISAENNLRATQRQALERLKERWKI